MEDRGCHSSNTQKPHKDGAKNKRNSRLKTEVGLTIIYLNGRQEKSENDNVVSLQK